MSKTLLQTDGTNSRVYYGQLLNPPEGYHLELGVATTYSLNLNALAAACSALDQDQQGNVNPLSFVGTLQRISPRLLVFCSDSHIQVPSPVRNWHPLLEQMIVPVKLEKQNGAYPAFHPKMWLLQYKQDTKDDRPGEYRYRFAVLSRNLTFDRSWDVAFALDGKETGQEEKKTAPLVEFLEFLRGEAVKGGTEPGILDTLIGRLKKVSFLQDLKGSGVHDMDIVPMGLPHDHHSMEAELGLSGTPRKTFQAFAVFSPFLTPSLVQEWNSLDVREKRLLVTRRSQLEKLKKEQADNFELWVLKDMASDPEWILEGADSPHAQKPTASHPRDIHAKLFVTETESETSLYLGSMNATRAALQSNVELMVCLHFHRCDYSVSAFRKDLFGPDPDKPSNPFQQETVADRPQVTADSAPDLNTILNIACRLNFRAEAREEEAGKQTAVWTIEVTVCDRALHADLLSALDQAEIAGSGLTLAPMMREASTVPLDPLIRNENSGSSLRMTFQGLHPGQVSELFLLRVEGTGQSASCVLRIPVAGMPADRQHTILKAITEDRRTFLEYFCALLGSPRNRSDPSGVPDLFEPTPAGETQRPWTSALSTPYELMLRTALDRPEDLEDLDSRIDWIEKAGSVPEDLQNLRALSRFFCDTLKKISGEV